jgi:hypothetical protein
MQLEAQISVTFSTFFSRHFINFLPQTQPVAYLTSDWAISHASQKKVGIYGATAEIRNSGRPLFWCVAQPVA